jgi:hypothetical protein
VDAHRSYGWEEMPRGLEEMGLEEMGLEEQLTAD